MTSRINFLILILVVSSLIATGCINNKADDPIDTELLSYQEFQQLLHDITENLAIPNYEIVETTQNNTTMIAVEKDLTFDTRQLLTVSGDQDGMVTQERLALENKEKSNLLLVDAIYLENPIENNMLFWKLNEGSFSSNYELFNQYHENLISYKNILFKVMLITNSENVDYTELINTTRPLVQYLKSY